MWPKKASPQNSQNRFGFGLLFKSSLAFFFLHSSEQTVGLRPGFFSRSNSFPHIEQIILTPSFHGPSKRTLAGEVKVSPFSVISLAKGIYIIPLCIRLWQLLQRLSRLSTSKGSPPCDISLLWCTSSAAVTLPCLWHSSQSGCLARYQSRSRRHSGVE